MYYIKQLKDDDCGFACLKMLLAKLNKCKNYIFLSQDLNHGSYSYQELIDIAKENKLELKGFKYNRLNDLRKDLKTWCIVTVNNDKVKHAVIIKKITKKQVYIIDPYLGTYELLKDEFEKIWDKTALIVINFSLQKIKKTQFKFINPALTIFSIICSSLSLISSFLGINYINKNCSFFIPLTFLGIFFIFEILYRIINLKIMRNMDKNILNDDLFTLKANIKTKDFYATFSTFKRSYITLISNILKSFIVSLFLIVVAIFNNPNHFLFVIGVLLFSILDFGLIGPFFKKLEKKISLEEEKVFCKTSLTNLNFVNKIAYKYASIFTFKNIMVIGLLILSIFFDMYMNDVYALSYLVMYTIWYYTLYKSFGYVFTLNTHLDEINLYKCILLNSLNRKTIK